MNDAQLGQTDNSNTQVDTEERDDAVIGIALRWSLVVIVVLAAIGGGIAFWLTRPKPEPPDKETELADVEVRDAPVVEIPLVKFTDVTKAAGIDFVHESGAYGKKLLPETMGSGCAFLDFDNDGDQDLLLVNAMRWPEDPRGTTDSIPSKAMALYRNDGEGDYQNVTAGSGVDVSFYGTGIAVGDYDNDGLVDVFISALGSDRLFHNEGNGKFRDVTQRAGVAGGDNTWGTSCGWFDYDNDGNLDLFVCNYLQWSREYDIAQNFQLTGGGRAYGGPGDFEGTFPYLYHNNGDGTFRDVTAHAGLQIRNPDTNVPMAKALGVTFSDFDADGLLDIVVANDTVQNFLFHNQGNGKFNEIGARTGVAFDANGEARGAMGIDIARFRNDDTMGIAIGNFATEMTALYVAKDNQMLFVDEAISTGLGPNTRQELTFGLVYFDYDLDGRQDLLAANGHLEEEINRVQSKQHYEQPAQLFWNCGPQHVTEFVPVPKENCGEDLLRPTVGRSLTYADIDGDGDLDVLLTAVARPPRLLRNDQELGHHWLRFKLVGMRCNRDAIGAQVKVKLKDRTLWRQVMPTRSYQSQVELPVTFGLGTEDQVESVTIQWPDGSTRVVEDINVDRLRVIEQEMK